MGLSWYSKVFFLTCLACNAFSACNDSKQAGDNPGAGSSTAGGSGSANAGPGGVAGFLVASDLAPPPASAPYTAPEAVATLTSSDDFYDNTPQQLEQNCYTALIYPHTWTAVDDHTLKLDLSFDASACMASLMSTAAVRFTVSSAAVHYLEVITCAAGGLSKFNGINAKQFFMTPSAQVCQGPGTHFSETKLMSASTYTGTNDQGQPIAGALADVTTNATVQPGLTPCPFNIVNNIMSHAAPCSSVTLDTSVNTPQNSAPVSTVKYMADTSSNRVELADAVTVWPTSGQSQVVMDNWTGFVNYNGPTTPPNYSLSAPGAAPIQGQFPPPGATPAAGLVDGSERSGWGLHGVHSLHFGFRLH